MTIIPVWIDVTASLQSGVQPIYHHRRPPLHSAEVRSQLVGAAQEGAWAGEFWSLRTGILDGVPPQWSVVRNGEFVAIPVHAYRTGVRGLAALFTAGLELGARAHQSFLGAAAGRPATEMVLVLGHDCTDLGADGFRCYAGIAFRTI